jgi:uncharacterized protein
MNQSIKKIVHFPVTKIIIGIVFCFALFVLIQNFIAKPVLYGIFPDKNTADAIIHGISVIVLLSSYYFLFRFYDKREITELSLKNFTKTMLGSIILGFGAISLTILILYLSGYYQILSVSMENYSLRLFGMLVMAALIEDLFHRALIARILENWLGTNIAIIVIMLLETMHMFNPNANLFSLFVDFVWGFTMTVLFVYSKNLWLPLFFHLGWNFAQLFYGSSLTGLNDMGRIITSKFGGPEIFNGGAVGVENSIFTVTTLLLIGIYFYRRAQKEDKIIPRKLFKTATEQAA